MKIEFYRHGLGEAEKASVAECLDGLFLTTGSCVAEFEKRFASYCGLREAVGLTSCTAGLHLSLLALEIGAGDEVITTPMTFIATATVILHVGATPVLVDVEPDTGLLDVTRVEEAITERTKAILPVHLYGQMCDMKALRELANKHRLKLIEDCAHALESARDGYRPGDLGDVACYSFYATKAITSGEGGAIATNNTDLASRIRLLRQHGMSAEAADRYGGRYQHWDMVALGWKYNMDNIQAALLLPQLDGIEDRWRTRDALYHAYQDALKDLPLVELPRVHNGAKSAYHLFTVWVPHDLRDVVLERMASSGVGVAVNYRAIHLLSYLRERLGYQTGTFPNAERIGDCTISLPFYPQLPHETARTVAKILGETIDNLQRS